MQKYKNTCMRVTSIIIIILFIYFLATWHVGSYFPNQGVNLCPLQWKCGLNHWTTIAGRFFTIWATTEAKNTGVGSLSLGSPALLADSLSAELPGKGEVGGSKSAKDRGNSISKDQSEWQQAWEACWELLFSSLLRFFKKLVTLVSETRSTPFNHSGMLEKPFSWTLY